MKTFWISLIIFLALLCGIGTNCIYVRRTTEQMLYYLEDGDTATLRAYWDLRRAGLSITVNEEKLEQTEIMLDTLRIHEASGNAEETAIDRAMLKSAIRELSRMERFDIQNFL